MNPGVTEEVSKVASSTVDALKQTPIVLALVIFNVMFMSLSVYVSLQSSARWDREIERWAGLVKSCETFRASP
jgi:copper chaperone CopZ